MSKLMVKERPILFSGAMVRAVLDGRKTQTRRVVKDVLLYSLTDDRIYGILNAEALHEKPNTEENSDLAERRLQGWIGRTNLFTNEIQRLWSQGLRGLVSIKRAHNKKGLSDGIALSPQHQSDKIGSHFNLHGLSWDATKPITSGSPFGWGPKEQQTKKSPLGNTDPELGGQEGSWAWERRGKTRHGKIIQSGLRAFAVGDQGWAVQSASGGEGSWNVAGRHITHSQFQKGLTLWGREKWATDSCFDDTKPSEIPESAPIIYEADVSTKPKCAGFKVGKSRPSIFMPRWASRITLEVKSVRVERLQEISEADAQKEGCERLKLSLGELHGVPVHPMTSTYVDAFEQLWDSINGEREGCAWGTNPHVWVVEFERVEV